MASGTRFATWLATLEGGNDERRSLETGQPLDGCLERS
jgi:hypothetical protein